MGSEGPSGGQCTPQIDLSDFDPFHPAQTASPAPPSLLFETRPAPPSTTSTAPDPRPPIALPSETIRPAQDPLALLSFSPEQDGRAPALSRHVAHERRQREVLDDLARDPWSIQSGASVGKRKDEAGGRWNGTGFSPPRRLSSLMSTSPPLPTTANGPSRNAPMLMSPPVEPFHPSSPPTASLENYFRQHSISSTSPRSQRAESSQGPGGKQEGNTAPRARVVSEDWSDFQSGEDDIPPPPPTSFPSTSTFASRSPFQRRKSHDKPPTSFHHPPPPPLPPKHARSEPVPHKEENVWVPPTDAFNLSMLSTQPLTLEGVAEDCHSFLSLDLAESLRNELPPRLRISHKWTLLYSLDQHGTSLSTLYSELDSPSCDAGFLLLITTTTGSQFGSFSNERLAPRPGFYGDNTCFLYKTTPRPPSSPLLGPLVRTYPSTSQNTYYLLSSSSSIAFGGGSDGEFGIWLDGYLETGWTGTCETFGNEALVEGKRGGGKKGRYEGGGVGFEIKGLEAWAVDP